MEPTTLCIPPVPATTTHTVCNTPPQTSLWGLYTYGGCILETNADGTIHGPGHHSILQEGNDYYIIYHRHDNPHSNRGFHRQLCIDRMSFNADGTIQKIIPTHDGVGALAPSVVKSANLAFGKSVRALFLL